MSDLTQHDLYKLFDVSETCTTQELTSAFRKTALTCHPDKFPDDNDKKERFLLIKRALELLTDKQARQTYDACRQQKIVQEKRISQMDEKRKKFKQDLEQNEQKASQANNSTINRANTAKLFAEVERLRREGSRLVDEELEKLHTIIEQDKRKSTASHRNVIITYLPNTPPYADNELRQIFGKYGNISTIVNMYPKRALIEFNDDHISKVIENEKGLDGRPFASVKMKKQTTTTHKPTEFVDLTKPDFEDFEAMMMKKMSQQTATS